MVLAGIMAHGNAAAQASAAKEIATLINKNLITAAVVADIDSAVKNSVLSGDQAVSIPAGVAANGMAGEPAPPKRHSKCRDERNRIGLITRQLQRIRRQRDGRHRHGGDGVEDADRSPGALRCLLAVAGDEATVAAAAVNQANTAAAAAASQAAAINPFNIGAYMSAAIASAQAQMNAASAVGGMEAKASGAIEVRRWQRNRRLDRRRLHHRCPGGRQASPPVTSQALPGDQAVALPTGVAAVAPGGRPDSPRWARSCR